MFRNVLKIIPPVFILMLFMISQNLYAQASGYLFNQTSGTYTAITGGTVLWSGTFDDEFSAVVTMPSFTFNGTAYTEIYISANGFVTLANANASYSPISSTTVSPGILSVFGRDINEAETGTPEVRYETVGNEFIVQWQDVRRYNVTGEIFSCQIRLNSSNNTIKFVYGGTITPGSNTFYPQIGLRGATNTDFNNRKIATGGGSWINSAAGSLNTDVMFFNSSDPTTVPSAGLTYTFTPPSILNPTGVTASPISSHQIDVAFTPYAGNNVVLVFNTTGTFTTPSGAPPAIGQPFAGGTLLYNGLVSPYHHTSLNASTTYYYRLFSYGGGNYSSGLTVSATTFCEAITSLPWTEGFEGVTIPALPNCWFKQNGDWVTTNNANSTYDADAHTGTQFLRESYLATNEYVWSPGFQLTAGTSYDFSFYWAGDTYAGWLGDVYVNNTQDSLGATHLGTSFVTLDITTTKTYQLATNTFVPASSGAYYFAIRVNCPTSTPWYLSFDDFRVETTPSCPMPQGLNVTGITNTGAYIGWTNASLVDIDYGTPGHPAGTGTVISAVGTNPYHLTGLSAFTSYDVYVRQNCGGGGYSSWAGPLNFTTLINPLTLPYTQLFDGATFPGGWIQSNAEWSISTTNLAGGTANEMHALYWSFTGATRLILGPINTSGAASLMLSFKHFYDDYGAGLTVKIQSSSDLVNWTDEVYSFISGNGNIGPETVNTTIANNLGTVTYIAWVIDGNHFQYDNWYVDDVVVLPPMPNDVGTLSIDVAGSIVPGSFAPKATVKNFGTSTNSFNVKMNITGGYTSTKSVSSLAPGATQQVTFDNWNPSLGQYDAQVFTMLGTDQYHNNDTLYKHIGVYPGLYTTGSNFLDGTYLGSGCTLNGYLYSIGGNTISALCTECYEYNVATDTWTQIASLPVGRRVLATAAAGNYVYAIGGSDASSVYQTTVYRYNITSNIWETVAPLPMTIGWGKAVVYNNHIYLAGGYDGVSTVLTSVYVYDIAANTWSVATAMPGPKFGGAFNVTGNKLVYVAGADDIDISSTVFVGTIDAGNPLLITWATMSNPYPGLNKTVHSEYAGKITELLRPKDESKKFHLPVDATSYPPGTMYRFDGAPWGSDGIIVASGSPTSDWIPANPSPTYLYKPATDTWEQQGDVPIPVLGASIGSVNSGNIWKLIVASGYTGIIQINATQIYTANLGGTTTFPLSVSIANGWNMVSVPGNNPAGQDITHWWINHTGTVYKFVPGSGYTGITTTIPGQGYWMKNSGAQTYNTGDEWPAGGIEFVTHSPISATLGWNMFGGYEDIVNTSALTTTPADKIVFPIYKFVPGTGYQSTTQIVPGFGYWVKVSAACQINVPEAMAMGKKEVAEFFKDDWGKITLIDAAGGSYTLYAVKGEVDLDQYELPPLPPAGLFDVRFGSGRVAENIDAEFKPIEMRGMVYPVTIKAEKMDIRIMDVTGKLISTNIKDGESITIDNPNIDKVMVTGQLIPDKYSLEQNYPNPFNPSTTIEFSLPENVKNVTISIYNILGEKVAELVNSEMLAGKYQYQWNAKNLASGMYIYEMRTEKFVSIKKMMLLK